MTGISAFIFVGAIIATAIKVISIIAQLSSAGKNHSANKKRMQNYNSSYGVNNYSNNNMAQGIYYSQNQNLMNQQMMDQQMMDFQNQQLGFQNQQFDLQNQQFMQDSLNNVTSIENGGTNFGIDMTMHDGLAGGFGGFDSFGGFGMF